MSPGSTMLAAAGLVALTAPAALATTANECTLAYTSASTGTPAKACMAVDSLMRCQARLANENPEEAKTLDEFTAAAQRSTADYDCDAQDGPGPLIRSTRGDIVMETDGDGDIQLWRYRRQTTSLWDLVERVDQLNATVGDGTDALRQQLTAAIQQAAGTASAAIADLQGDVGANTERIANQAKKTEDNSGRIGTVDSAMQSSIAAIAECGDDGMVTVDGGQCAYAALRSCPELPEEIENGHFGGHNTERLVGSSEEVICDPGFGPKPSKLVCLSSGKWSDGSPECESCEKAKKDRNGDDVPEGATCGACSEGVCTEVTAPGMTPSGAVESCTAMKKINRSAKNGLYWLVGSAGNTFQTYCDFTTNGGSWQLIASIHEDNIRAKCNSEDRWASTDGNNGGDTNGDGNWVNDKTFGKAESACSTDFKSPAYFGVDARDIMVWHVPDGTEMDDWEKQALWKYRTTSNNYLGNFDEPTFQGIYKKWPPRSGQHGRCNHRGDTRVTMEGGTRATDRSFNDFYSNNVAPNSRRESTPGFITFSQYNNEGGCNPFCPGVRYNGCNSEHACIGTGGYMPEGNPRQCGDFSGWDWDGYGSANGRGWSASKRYTDATVLIFTRSG